MKESVQKPVSLRELAYVEVASSELTRDINRDLILERIRSLQPISRVDLSRMTGMQPSTVSSIVEQLLKEKWICEGAIKKTARGRRPTMLSLNENLLILAADVRPAQAVLAVLDLNGRFLSRSVVPLPTDAVASIKAIGDGMIKLREQHADKVFEGAGLSVQGRVDPATNRLVLVPNMPWKDVDVCGVLAKRLKLRVELENDANACLLSELWFGHVDRVRNAVLVAVSEGVGAAILAEGRLIGGSHGLAGEFGHVCVDPAGPKCNCGKHGCWETVASSRAALRYYRAAKPGSLPISMAQLVGLAVSGDAAASHALVRQAEAVGRGLRIINATLSPEVIFFAGDLTLHWDRSQKIIERECMAGLLAGRGPRLVSIGDGELALLRGAAAVVLQRHSGYYKSSHAKRPRPRHAAVRSRTAAG
jgi:predicted NBD/HSP70 family sugar kinase